RSRWRSGVFKTGGKTRNRTGDTLIFSQLLYQLSYLAVGGINRGKGSKGRHGSASTGILPHIDNEAILLPYSVNQYAASRRITGAFMTQKKPPLAGRLSKTKPRSA